MAGIRDVFANLKSMKFAQRYGAKPSAMTLGLECPPEPDAVERLAAVTDPEIKKKIEYQKLARELWLVEDANRKRMQAETARHYAAQDVKATLSMYENYAEMDDYPEMAQPYFANEAKRVE